jgi:thioredoxin reductase
MAFRYIPEQLIGLPEPLCFHSTRFGDVHAYKGREVVVIGAGQSALETAVLLHEAGANVRLMAKIEAPEWNHSPKSNRTILDSVVEPESGLGFGWKALALSELPQIFRWRFSPEVRHRFVANSWGPAGAWWMRKRFEGVIDGLFGSQIESAAEVGGRVRLTVDGPGGKKVIETDHVIAGTGFKVDVDRLEFIDASLRSEIAREFSAPVLDSHFETSVPGLFIVGVASAPTFGPVMRFMFGAKHVAPALTRRLSARRS